MSKSGCAPQRVVVSLNGGAASAAPSSATGRFVAGEVARKRIEGEIWHRLEAGESCVVPRKTGVRVLSGVAANMRGEVRNLMFRGEGRLTGPLIYRETSYAGVRGAMLAGATIIFVAILFPAAIVAISEGLDSEHLRPIACVGAGLMAGLAGFMGGVHYLLAYRKTKVFNQPDFEAAEIGVETISPEVKS